jgi:hypothetical protein
VQEPEKVRKITTKLSQIKKKKNICDTLLTEMQMKEINRQKRHEESVNLKLTQVAKNHLSFATAFFSYF